MLGRPRAGAPRVQVPGFGGFLGHEASFLFTAVERKGNDLRGFTDILTENGSGLGQNLALTVLHVPYSLDRTSAARARKPYTLDPNSGGRAVEKEFFVDNLLVRIHSIIVMIRWTGLAPKEIKFPFSGSLTSPFLKEERHVLRTGDIETLCLPRRKHIHTIQYISRLYKTYKDKTRHVNIVKLTIHIQTLQYIERLCNA